MEKRYGMPLTKNLDIWPTFIELTERRNLFVHTGGVVSQQYLDVCRKHGVEGVFDVERGATLNVDKDYFMKAHACVFEIGAKLVHTLWRKFKPEERSAADVSFMRLCYDLIVSGRYGLACSMSDFAAGQNTFSSAAVRLRIVINHARAHKWAGDERRARQILSCHDWSANANELRLAEAVLTSNFDAALRLMHVIGSKGEPSKDDYRSWPLFKEFNQDERFKLAFQKIFHEPFDEPSATEMSITQELKELEKLAPELRAGPGKSCDPPFSPTDASASDEGVLVADPSELTSSNSSAPRTGSFTATDLGTAESASDVLDDRSR